MLASRGYARCYIAYMQTKVKLILMVVVIVVIAGASLLTLILSSSGTSPASTDSPSSAKLNIAAVCEGALAYMSFSDGASAKAFVQECKEGKHPEVIERWKADNGITDDRAI